MEWILLTNEYGKVVYFKADSSEKTVVTFDLDNKSLSVLCEKFKKRPDVDEDERLSSSRPFSARYGYWEKIPSVFSYEDLQWINNKTKELFEV